LRFYEGVGVGVLKIEELESEVLCTDATALHRPGGDTAIGPECSALEQRHPQHKLDCFPCPTYSYKKNRICTSCNAWKPLSFIHSLYCYFSFFFVFICLSPILFSRISVVLFVVFLLSSSLLPNCSFSRCFVWGEHVTSDEKITVLKMQDRKWSK
jgi:hypothetical protein